uniref:Alanyl-transfer RNA synthetases family profile domain-containing protein n=1 Tax=Pyramimonas obovata TaxID=1411642 RepID=A0A7S0WG47_9CHLO|mmetsp:Transcript_249/g.596  ORF Transcript_249/g.596 Transcript_249/m.596 type:complete len:432 (+) Transcript_249:59-1354(+)|eukprot:CAMPEP_0118930580 /NCGR_PEP_ID=MMETSP1169-20130426/7216_1 /TAXON_ID=36882 /ORGANISM="Pyramimonas obovata, Strain CCMP722" /LENGTH=431 /DNA_ID=CAMNT_0006872957 /DNA_START=26 /DNA_END=1321 /DNA_ORIENTATION=-
MAHKDEDLIIESPSALAYQSDAYLRSVLATVLTCEPCLKQSSSKKSKQKDECESSWHVTLSDTVLYPEGGGQPSDYGTVNGVRVIRVETIKGACVHVCAEPLPVGSQVEVVVDWDRRFDHMQQHTGQHVLSAVADIVCCAPTISWELSAGYVNVDLAPEGEISAENVSAIEARANVEIRTARQVKSLELDGTVQNENPAHLRGKLPPVGTHKVVRLVEIEGLDVNACGGTHVRSTAELQLLKVIRVEKVKGSTRLIFAVGGRVLDMLQGCLVRQTKITSLLSSGPEGHVERIETLLRDKRSAGKRIDTLLGQVAELRGKELASELERSGSSVAVSHYEDEDLPFLQLVVDAAQKLKPDAVYFLSGGSSSNGGVFLLQGPPKVVEQVGKQSAEVIGGRGGGRNGKMQGKATKLDCISSVAPILEEAMQNLSI